MKTIKKLGICMDHAHAHLIEFSDEIKITETVSLDFDHQDKNETLHRSESEMNNKQQQRQHGYYKKLAAIIKDFTEVVLLGPTNAKSELFNFLRQNRLFDSIKIDVIHADEMSDKKQHEFVTEYFKRGDVKMHK